MPLKSAALKAKYSASFGWWWFGQKQSSPLQALLAWVSGVFGCGVFRSIRVVSTHNKPFKYAPTAPDVATQRRLFNRYVSRSFLWA